MKKVVLNYLVIAALLASAALTSCEKSYTVTLEDCGGRRLSETLREGEKISAIPGDWFYGDTQWDFDNVVTSNMTLVQKCPKEFIVYFEIDGGTSISAQTVTEGGQVTEPSPAPTKEGYTFGGWFKEEALITEWKFDIDVVTADLTLYAKWIPDNENPVAPELIGKWEVKSMFILDYDETVMFPYVGEFYPNTIGFEFTPSKFKVFTNGILTDEAEVSTVGNTINVSSEIREYKDFTWELSGNTLTLTVTFENEGGQQIYTCQKVDKFSWE